MLTHVIRVTKTESDSDFYYFINIILSNIRVNWLNIARHKQNAPFVYSSFIMPLYSPIIKQIVIVIISNVVNIII